MAGFTCSLAELDVIGAALEVDGWPFPFDVPRIGETSDDRTRLIALAARGLAERGLFNGKDFTPELVRSVLLLTRGEVSIAMTGVAGERTYGARVSTDGQFGVLAAQEGQRVRFESINADGLVRAVVGLLPPMKPGPGSSVSVALDGPEPPARGRRRADDDDDYSEQSWMEQARPKRDNAAVQAGAIETIFKRPRLGTGSWQVSVRDRRGNESDSGSVDWMDTDAGRYMVTKSQGDGGRLHLAYTPADQARIDQALTRIVSDVW